MAVILIPIILLSILPNYYLLVVGISKMYDVFLNMGQNPCIYYMEY